MESGENFDYSIVHDTSKYPDISVEMYDWTKVESPMVVATTGLGPCIGVIVYNEKNKKAYIGHFPSIEKQCRNMLDTVNKECKDKSHLKIYLGGGEPLKENPEFTEHNKHELQKSLESIGVQNYQIHTEWLPQGYNTIMVIDTNTGHVEYDTLETPGEDDLDV